MTGSALKCGCALTCLVVLTGAVLGQHRGPSGGGRGGPHFPGGGVPPGLRNFGLVKPLPAKHFPVTGGPAIGKRGPAIGKRGPAIGKRGPVLIVDRFPTGKRGPGLIIDRFPTGKRGPVVVAPGPVVFKPVYVLPGFGNPGYNPYINPGVVPDAPPTATETAPEDAEEPEQEVRYLRVSNQTGEPLTVYVKVGDGESRKWNLPAETVAYLTVDGERLAASEVFIWGQSESQSWTRYRAQPLVLVDEAYQSATIDTFTFTFNR